MKDIIKLILPEKDIFTLKKSQNERAQGALPKKKSCRLNMIKGGSQML